MEQTNYPQPPKYNGAGNEPSSSIRTGASEMPRPISQEEIDENCEVEETVNTTKNLFYATLVVTALPLILNYIFIKFMLKDKWALSESDGFWLCESLAEVAAYVMGGIFIWRFFRYLAKFSLSGMQRYSLLGLIAAFAISALCSIYSISLDEYETDTEQSILMFQTCLTSAALVFAAVNMYRLEIKNVCWSMVVAAIVTFVVALYGRSLLEEMEDIDFYSTLSDIKAIFFKSAIAQTLSTLAVMSIYQFMAVYLGVKPKKQ